MTEKETEKETGKDLIKRIVVKKLQAVKVKFDGTPRMSLDEAIKILL